MLRIFPRTPRQSPGNPEGRAAICPAVAASRPSPSRHASAPARVPEETVFLETARTARPAEKRTSPPSAALDETAIREVTQRNKFEEEISGWEKRFELIIAASGQVVYDYDLTTGRIMWSGSLLQVLGYTREEMGGIEEWAGMIHPEDRAKALRLLEIAEKELSTYDVDYRFRHKNGGYRWLHDRGFFLVENEGRTRRMIGMMKDVTDRKQAGLLQSAVYRIAQAANSSASLEDLYRSVHETMATVMPAGNFYIALYDDARDTISFPYFVDEMDAPPPPQKAGKGLTEYIIRTGRSLLCDEVADMDLRGRGEVEVIGAPSAIWLGVPLIVDGKTIGAMVVQHYSDPLAYGNAERRMLEFVSSQVAQSIERKLAEERLRRGLDKLRTTLKASIDSLASAIEMRDPYTAGHQERVTHLARAIAVEMGLAGERLEAIEVAGAIHDIGKLYVPAEILSKPTKLTEIEYALIKMHAQAGYTILGKIDFPWPIADIVHQHHEYLNGSGYPQGLHGKDILLESKILCVADIVEAMSSHRPYRPALGIQAALDEISQKRGILYDREVVDACLTLFRAKKFKFD